MLPLQCLLCFIKKKKKKKGFSQPGVVVFSNVMSDIDMPEPKNKKPSGMVVKVRISVSAGDVLKEDGLAILLVHIIHPLYLELAVASQGKAF